MVEAAEFLVFCADYHRHSQIVPEARTGFVEQLMIGAIDGALMAQNALLAAQSLGLGGVYIGGIRNNPAEVSEVLGLPHQVIPLFGLCLVIPPSGRSKTAAAPGAGGAREPLSCHPGPRPAGPVRRADPRLLPGPQQQQQGSDLERADQGILGKEARPFMLGFLQSKGFASSNGGGGRYGARRTGCGHRLGAFL